MYSIVETVKENNIDVERYIKYVLENIYKKYRNVNAMVRGNSIKI